LTFTENFTEIGGVKCKGVAKYSCFLHLECYNSEIVQDRLFAFFEKRPLVMKFSKFCSESLHRDTDRRCCVQYSCKLSDGKSVKACVIYLTKNKHFFGSLSNCGYCADRAQSLLWPAPNIWLTTFQISSKSVHFRRTYSRPREDRSKCTIES